MIVKKVRIKQFAIPHLSKCESRAREKSLQLAKMRSKFLEPSADVSRDNNLYVVGDISKYRSACERTALY